MRGFLACLVSLFAFSATSEAQVFKRLTTPVRQLAQCFGPDCQQSKSFSGFVVGQRDADGAVITSVGPVADPVPNAVASLSMTSTPTLAPPVDEVSILARRSDFRQAFLKAVREARDKGEITALQHGRLIVASLRPRELANIQAWVHENAIQEGLATAQTPDWGAIIDFIERLIPLIMQLIDLFGSNVNPHSDFQYAMLQPQNESKVVCDWSWTGVAA